MKTNPHILIGVGNEYISDILRKYLHPSEQLHVIEQEVMHFRFLEEIVESEEPDILIVHDVFLPSDTVGKEEREQEWLKFIHLTRQRYENLRIVFLCERYKDDVFLNQLIGLGILDIFNEAAIDMELFVNQLSIPARYANVAKFRVNGTSATVKFEGEKKEEIDDKAEEDNEDVGVKNSANEIDKQDETKKKEKPETKEVIVEKTVERIVAYPLQKKIILVGSPFQRSGSTFVSHLIAKEIAKLELSVTYIENPYQRGYSYDRFDGHRKTENHRSVFHSYIKDKKPQPSVSYKWNLDGVNMNVKHPTAEPIYNEKQINFELFVKVLLTNDSNITIIDIGNDWNRKVYQELLDIASDVIMVMEPDISNIQYLEDPKNKETATFRHVLELEKTMLIGNRFNESLLKNKLIKDLYGDEVEIAIPEYPIEAVFECQEKATFVNTHKDHKEQIEQLLFPLLELLLPENLLRKKKKKKKTGLFRHIFHRNTNHKAVKSE